LDAKGAVPVRYRDAAFTANHYVRRTVAVQRPPEVRGAVKGSFPVDGGYRTYEYLNLACKFFVDAQMLERAVLDADGAPAHPA
jgi:hypothetical protein